MFFLSSRIFQIFYSELKFCFFLKLLSRVQELFKKNPCLSCAQGLIKNSFLEFKNVFEYLDDEPLLT